MVQQMTARERILTLHAQGKSPELIASEVFTTIEHVMNVIVTAPDAAQYPVPIHTSSMSTPAPGALATAQPAVDSPMELATSLLVDYEQERQKLTLERDRLKQDCANLREALEVVVNDWTSQFEKNGHLAPSWCKQARAALKKTEP